MPFDLSEPTPIFITAAEVAALLEYDTPRQFQRQRARLTAEEGFPLPIPLNKRTLRWRRDDVIAWRDRLTGLPDPTAMIDPDMPGNIVQLRRMAQTA